MAAALLMAAGPVSPVAGQSCDNIAGVWRASTGDLSPMTVEQNGCNFRATFVGTGSGVHHVVEGVAGLNQRMTVTRTDRGGCVMRMYGNVFLAVDGRTLWWSLDRTDGGCGVGANHSETRRFDLAQSFRREVPPRDVHEPRERINSGPNRGPAGEPSDASRQAEKAASLESRRGLEQAASGRDRGDVGTSEAGAKRAEAAARSVPGNAEAQANARDARAAADKARAQQGGGTDRGGNQGGKGGGNAGNRGGNGGGNAGAGGGAGSAGGGRGGCLSGMGDTKK